MFYRPANDTIEMVHHQISTLHYRMKREGRYLDELKRATAGGESIGAHAAWQLACDVASLRELADALEDYGNKLHPQEDAPCLVSSLDASLVPSLAPAPGI
jgi:hypothetical protein